jgi:hypothetical protein
VNRAVSKSFRYSLQIILNRKVSVWTTKVTKGHYDISCEFLKSNFSEIWNCSKGIAHTCWRCGNWQIRKINFHYDVLTPHLPQNCVRSSYLTSFLVTSHSTYNLTLLRSEPTDLISVSYAWISRQGTLLDARVSIDIIYILIVRSVNRLNCCFCGFVSCGTWSFV